MSSIKANIRYRAPGDVFRLDGIDFISTDIPKYGEPNKMNRFAYPIQVPSSGQNYSFEKWISFECEEAPDSPIDELKIWADKTQPATGVVWYARIQDDFERPTQPTSMTSVSGTGTISISGTAVITGTNTLFTSELTDGKMIRVPGVDRLFQPCSPGNDRVKL